MFAIPFIAYLGYMLFFLNLGVRPLLIPITSASVIIIIGYVCGIFDILYLYKFFGTGIGFVLMAYSLTKFQLFPIDISRWNKSLKYFCYFVYLVPFYVLINAVSDSYYLTYWDEFSCWGTSVKYMYLTDELFTKSPQGGCYSYYPPAQQLFQYFFIQFTDWSESTLLKLKLFLALSALVALFDTSKKNILYGAIGFLGSIPLMYYFHYQYQVMYVDDVLAFYFAATAVLILSTRNLLIDKVIISILLFVIVLLKPIALIFALMLIPILFLKSFFSQLKFSTNQVIFYPRFNLRNNSSFENPYSFGWLFINIIVILLSYFTWIYFLNSIDIPPRPSAPAIIKYFEFPLAAKLISATHVFLIRLNEICFTLPIKLYQLIILLGATGVILSQLNSSSLMRARDSLIFLWLTVACISYFLFLLYSYISFFSDFEGSQLYGIERYTATFLIAWCLILYGNVVSNYLTNKFAKFFVVSIFLIVLFIYPPKDFFNLIIRFPISQDNISKREKLNSLGEMINTLDPGAKLYFISQISNGFEGRIFQYTVMPRFTSIGSCSSFGSPYHKEDIYTCNKNIAESIKGYDYLVIHYADEKFWNQARKLLLPGSAEKDMGIYQIIDSNDGIRLKILK